MGKKRKPTSLTNAPNTTVTDESKDPSQDNRANKIQRLSDSPSSEAMLDKTDFGIEQCKTTDLTNAPGTTVINESKDPPQDDKANKIQSLSDSPSPLSLLEPSSLTSKEAILDKTDFGMGHWCQLIPYRDTNSKNRIVLERLETSPSLESIKKVVYEKLTKRLKMADHIRISKHVGPFGSIIIELNEGWDREKFMEKAFTQTAQPKAYTTIMDRDLPKSKKRKTMDTANTPDTAVTNESKDPSQDNRPNKIQRLSDSPSPEAILDKTKFGNGYWRQLIPYCDTHSENRIVLERLSTSPPLTSIRKVIDEKLRKRLKMATIRLYKDVKPFGAIIIELNEGWDREKFIEKAFTQGAQPKEYFIKNSAQPFKTREIYTHEGRLYLMVGKHENEHSVYKVATDNLTVAMKKLPEGISLSLHLDRTYNEGTVIFINSPKDFSNEQIVQALFGQERKAIQKELTISTTKTSRVESEWLSNVTPLRVEGADTLIILECNRQGELELWYNRFSPKSRYDNHLDDYQQSYVLKLYKNLGEYGLLVLYFDSAQNRNEALAQFKKPALTTTKYSASMFPTSELQTPPPSQAARPRLVQESPSTVASALNQTLKNLLLPGAQNATPITTSSQPENKLSGNSFSFVSTGLNMTQKKQTTTQVVDLSNNSDGEYEEESTTDEDSGYDASHESSKWTSTQSQSIK